MVNIALRKEGTNLGLKFYLFSLLYYYYYCFYLIIIFFYYYTTFSTAFSLLFEESIWSSIGFIGSGCSTDFLDLTG